MRGMGLLILAMPGCGPGTRVPIAAPDSSVASDTAAPEDDSGTYRSGSSNTCCGLGSGLTCCTADSGLLGYDVKPDGAIVAVGARTGGGTEANCFQYGGIVGTCAGDGLQFDGKEPCVVCCPGLKRVNQAVANDGGVGPDACMQILGIFSCLPCGDGICEPDENQCTCPIDCP
jgi:hypothetical protein